MREQGRHQRTTLPLLLGLALLLSGCGSAFTARYHDAPWLNTFAVTFAPSVAYASALRTVTDLGLQPGMFCSNGPSTISNPWQPMGEWNAFAQSHRLLVDRVSEPLDWEDRLLQTPGVLAVQDGIPLYPGESPPGVGPASTTYPCPVFLPEATPPPGVPVSLNAGNSGTYAWVAFSAPLSTYDAALYTVSNLGLALANPCYDQVAWRPTPPPWQSPGQETSFAVSQALVVVTTKSITSNLWQTQLRATAGVRVIQSGYTPPC